MMFAVNGIATVTPALLWWGVLAFAVADPVVQTPELRWAAVIISVCGVATVMFQYLQTRSQNKTNIRLKEIDLAIKGMDDNQAKRDEDSARREYETSLQVRQAAMYVADVRTDLKHNTKNFNRKLDDQAKVMNASHEFLNSERGVTLKEKWTDKLRIAELSQNHRDFEIAAEAEEAFRRHNDAQNRVNAQPGTDAQKSGDIGVSDAEEGKVGLSGDEIRSAIAPPPTAQSIADDTVKLADDVQEYAEAQKVKADDPADDRSFPAVGIVDPAPSDDHEQRHRDWQEARNRGRREPGSGPGPVS